MWISRDVSVRLVSLDAWNRSSDAPDRSSLGWWAMTFWTEAADIARSFTDQASSAMATGVTLAGSRRVLSGTRPFGLSASCGQRRLAYQSPALAVFLGDPDALASPVVQEFPAHPDVLDGPIVGRRLRGTSGARSTLNRPQPARCGRKT